jgi:hypothetical protein
MGRRDDVPFLDDIAENFHRGYGLLFGEAFFL